MKRRTTVLALASAAVSAASGWALIGRAPRAGATASGSAAAELAWLSRLPSGLTNRVASGFFAGYSGNGFSMDQVEEVRSLAGGYPAILGCDYGAGRAVSGGTAAAIDHSCNATLKSWWSSGGLVSVSVRPPNPGGPAAGFDTPMDGFADLLDTGTEAGARWRGYLDAIATGLADLRSAGVPVIFRPFPGMNGDGCWWGGQDTATFQAVWRDMYAYLTGRGLSNLLWAYNPDAGWRGRTGYYPGSSYVDLVALDALVDQPGGSDVASAYQELTSLGKPFGFGEIGPGTPGGFDYGRWLNAIKLQYPQTTFFLARNGAWSPARNSNGATFLRDAWMITRDEVRFQ